VSDYMEAHDRPPGIVLLSTIYLVSGVSIGGVLIASIFKPEFARGFAERAPTGSAVVLLIAGVIVLSALSIETAAGLWQRAKWAWFLGSFWYAFAIVRDVSAIVVINYYSHLPSVLDAARATNERAHLTGALTGRVVASVLLYYYFFKSNVRAYFDLTTAKLWKATVIQLAIGVCLIGVLSATFRAAGLGLDQPARIASLWDSNSEPR
jgi:hypothetical protein